MFGFLKSRRRSRLRAAPFPVEWLGFIEKNVRYCACLPEADRLELQGLIQILLAEKSFEGCGGLVLTDEIKVTIAAQAALLLLHRNTDFYPKLNTVLVYPSAMSPRPSHRSETALLSRVKRSTSANLGVAESSCSHGMKSARGRLTFRAAKTWCCMNSLINWIERMAQRWNSTPGTARPVCSLGPGLEHRVRTAQAR